MIENGNLPAIFKASRLSSPHHGATVRVIVKGSEAAFYCKVPTKIVFFFVVFSNYSIVHASGFRRIICEEVTRVWRNNDVRRIARDKKQRIRTKVCSGNLQRRDRVGDKRGGTLILKDTSREEDVLLFATAGGCRLDSAARFLEHLCVP